MRIPELVPIRYGRMAASPLAFLRGSAIVMAADLAVTPVTGLRVQACGDAHLSNFGVFATPERHLVFDLNDFDETLPAPFEWDLKRLAASVVVAGRVAAFSEPACRAGARTCAMAYREKMAEYAAMGALEVWYSRDRRRDGARAAGQRRAPAHREARRQGSYAHEPRGAGQAHAHRGRTAGHRRRPAAGRARAARPRPGRGRAARRLQPVQGVAAGGAPHAARPLPVRGRGAQGGGRRQRRHPGVHRAPRRRGRRRSAVPPDQGGPPVGARAPRRAERVSQLRQAGRVRPAPHAGGLRPVPGLDPRRRGARLLRPPAARHEGRGRHRTSSCRPTS